MNFSILQMPFIELISLAYDSGSSRSICNAGMFDGFEINSISALYRMTMLPLLLSTVRVFRY